MPQLDFLSQLPEEEFNTFRTLCTDIILVSDMSHHAEIMAELFTRMPGFNLTKPDDRVLLMKLAVKCADVATSAMECKLYCHASELFFQELHAQGDRERAEGLPISPLCDRTTFNMVDAQVPHVAHTASSLSLGCPLDCWALRW